MFSFYAQFNHSIKFFLLVNYVVVFGLTDRSPLSSHIPIKHVLNFANPSPVSGFGRGPLRSSNLSPHTIENEKSPSQGDVHTCLFGSKDKYNFSMKDPRVVGARARRVNERMQRRYQKLRQLGKINLQWYHCLPKPHAYKGRPCPRNGMSRWINWRVPPKRLPPSSDHPGQRRVMITKSKNQPYTEASPYLRSNESSKRRRYKERRPDDPLMRSLPRSWRRKIHFTSLKQRRLESEYARHVAVVETLGHDPNYEKSLKEPPTREEMIERRKIVYIPGPATPMMQKGYV
eukprot:GHVN01085289.1.p1 GENE.GHVN01085289.1~~GHVN01085289.1.p1  ORF type:complete len:288 (-),score=46.89 GHVN01085289.1:478-1341(-)